MRESMHTPWSDEVYLLKPDPETDAEGYDVPERMPRRRVFCTFEEGVSQSEFYQADKAGLQASASVELWTADYEGEELVLFADRYFRVIRAFQSSFDCKTLILSEVIR